MKKAYTWLFNYLIVGNELEKLRSVKDLVEVLMEENFLEDNLGRQKPKEVIGRTGLAAGK